MTALRRLALLFGACGLVAAKSGSASRVHARAAYVAAYFGSVHEREIDFQRGGL